MYFYCYVCSVYSVPLCRSVYCLCVNVYCITATGRQSNCSKQNISYHIILQAYTLRSALCDDHERSGTDKQGGGPGPVLLDLPPQYSRKRGKT
jgi:hypothetical protein